MVEKALVRFRAVHVKTRWRRVQNHHSLQNALTGLSDGAPALFAGRTRIDHQKHGPALFVVAWQEGEEVGHILKPNPAAIDRPHQAIVPRAVLDEFEARGGASILVLDSFFTPLPSGRLDAVPPEGLEGAVSLRRHMRRERIRALADA